jgi:hypothetical protein
LIASGKGRDAHAASEAPLKASTVSYSSFIRTFNHSSL